MEDSAARRGSSCHGPIFMRAQRNRRWRAAALDQLPTPDGERQRRRSCSIQANGALGVPVISIRTGGGRRSCRGATGNPAEFSRFADLGRHLVEPWRVGYRPAPRKRGQKQPGQCPSRGFSAVCRTVDRHDPRCRDDGTGPDGLAGWRCSGHRRDACRRSGTGRTKGEPGARRRSNRRDLSFG